VGPQFVRVLLHSAIALACIGVHEFGHALAAWLSGCRVASYSIVSLRPHVRVEGNRTDAQRAMQAGAGTALIITLSAAAICMLPRAVLASPWAATPFVVAMVELCGWLLSSIFYPLGPRGDDATKFLTYSGVNPWLMAAICSLVAAGITVLFISRRRVRPAPALARAAAA
jgi:hypothetical protein